MSEAQFGELSFFRVYSGLVKFGSELYNTARRSTEKIGQIYLLNGKTRTSVPTLSAGDIGAVVKLKDHPHGQHAVRRQEAGDAAESRLPQAEHPRLPQEQRQRRGRQSRLGPGGAAPRRPDVPLHGGFRTAPDHRLGAGRTAPGGHRRQRCAAVTTCTWNWSSRACAIARPSRRGATPSIATRSRPAAPGSSPKSGCGSSPNRATPGWSSPTRWSARTWTACSCPPSRRAS